MKTLTYCSQDTSTHKTRETGSDFPSLHVLNVKKIKLQSNLLNSGLTLLHENIMNE